MGVQTRIDGTGTTTTGGSLPFVPRLLSADLAAVYLGISKTNLLARVSKSELPTPRRIGGRVLWDRHILDRFVDAMFGVSDNTHFVPEEDDWDKI